MERKMKYKVNDKVRLKTSKEFKNKRFPGHWIPEMQRNAGTIVTITNVSTFDNRYYVEGAPGAYGVYWKEGDFKPAIGDWDE